MMSPFDKRLRARASACWHQAQQHSPRCLTTGVLLAAVALAMAHYTFGDWVIYPGVALWKERAFWAVFPLVVCVPLLHWFVWTVVSLGRLQPAPAILAAAAILCVGDLVWQLVWLNITAFDFDFRIAVDYWDWWAYWLPVVMVVGNLFLARLWWHKFRPAKSREAVASAILADVEPGLQPGGKNRTSEKVSVKLERHGQTGELSGRQDAALYGRPGCPPLLFKHALRVTALFLAWCAVVLTAIHLVLPRMTVNDFTLFMADVFLVRDEWRKDFDFVVRNSVSRGKRLGALLEHASLAHLQRHHFYENVDESVYQQFVLCPDVDRTPLSELDWRRTLWEHFYPRVRREHDPAVAAQTVVRYLRERVGIDPAYSYRVGVETIWTQQMTDATGFERIYVAALRSVGIAARLGADQRAELWAGNAWHEAPRPIVANWSTRGESKH